jgi:hypothetical protein
LIFCKVGVSLAGYSDAHGQQEISKQVHLTLIFIKDCAMSKILLALIVGLFTLNTYAADLPKAEPAKVDTAKVTDTVKADATKHTAAPTKKASLMKKTAKKEAEDKSAVAK